jgi:hypothetical protein
MGDDHHRTGRGLEPLERLFKRGSTAVFRERQGFGARFASRDRADPHSLSKPLLGYLCLLRGEVKGACARQNQTR